MNIRKKAEGWQSEENTRGVRDTGNRRQDERRYRRA